jgi:DNA-binding transcriptional MerR regulator
MRTKQLADACGVSPDTIRFYESEGLLPPPRRTTTGYRVFGAEDLARVQFIRKAQRLGFALLETKDILRLHDLREQPCRHVRTLLDGKIAHVEILLRDLHDLAAELVQLRERANSQVSPRPANGCICGIIEQAPEGHGQVAMAWLSKRAERRLGASQSASDSQGER